MAEIEKADLLLREQREFRIEMRDSQRELVDAMRSVSETLIRGFTKLGDGTAPPPQAQGWLVYLALFGLLGTFLGPVYLMLNYTQANVMNVARVTAVNEAQLDHNTAEMAADKADDEARFGRVADVMNLQHENQERWIGVLWSRVFPDTGLPAQDYWPLLDDR